MVFESLLADILNRFLGDYVENLDAKQLNVGIWGGDVQLKNLEIKESALDSFDFPIKLKFGCLDQLVLKIPWANLYTEAVTANIEGLYLIIVPNRAVPYDKEKADKLDFENKQKALARLEENRKKKRKPTEVVADDTFTEKLISHIVKNLQIKIKNIHVRYEDKFTDGNRPFAAGATLESLNFETTDDNWKATIHKETLKIFYKIIHLNNMAVYWNSFSTIITDSHNRIEIRKELIRTISTHQNQPADHKYILEPVQLNVKLKLNQRPENDGSNWTIPKIDLGFDLELLAMGLLCQQYKDAFAFLNSLDRFTVSARYLKYRPNLNIYKGHYREWWKFAYNAILEENIRRRRNNWSWKMMKQHRQIVKNYRQAWVRKLTEKSLPVDVINILEEAEQKLDVFNLNIARQQAELEIDRRGLTRLEDQKEQGWVDWAKSWFGVSSTDPHNQKKAKHGDDIISQFEQAMNPEEKAKLYAAIDYQENMPPTDYPARFVERRARVQINRILMKIEDTLELQFSRINSLFEHCPSGRAMSITNSIKSLVVTGINKSMFEILNCKADWSMGTQCAIMQVEQRCDKAQNAIVSIESVHFKLSPAVSYLYNSLSSGFLENSKEINNKSSSFPILPEFVNFWDAKRFDKRDYWWFKEIQKNVIENLTVVTAEALVTSSHTERLDFSIDNCKVTVEADSNDNAMPVILFDSSVKGVAKDWASLPTVDAFMDFQMSYYNEQQSVWEPVIEPLWRAPDRWDRWNLNARIRSHHENERVDDAEGRTTLMPKMTIDLTASETLNITATKTFIQLLSRINKAFEEACHSKTESLRSALLPEDNQLHFRNLLPIDINFTFPVQKVVKPGEEIALDAFEYNKLQFWIDYNGEHEATLHFGRDHVENLEIITLFGSNSELSLGIYWGTEYSHKECSIYAPYWIVNSTGKKISYVVSNAEILHNPAMNPVLMPFTTKQFHSKKKARLRVEDSDLSDSFPVDTVGDAGRLICKAKDGSEYEVTVDVQLCQASLTKIVTFTSFYLLQNSSKFAIEVREYGGNWIEVPAEMCIPFWPIQKAARKFMCARYSGMRDEESLLFPFTENFEEFCSTNNKHVGFYVVCTVTESSSIINIDSFQIGMASALLINDTDTPIKYLQQGLHPTQGFVLMPQQQKFFTYSDLGRKERAIEWSSGNFSGVISLLTDNLSSYAPANNRNYYYWASFLNGRQRTVLFTQDLSVATVAKETYEMERIEQQIELSLHGIGISIVNNLVGQEIVYAGISSSGIIWQQKVRTRFRPFVVKSMERIEQAYQEWLDNGQPNTFVDLADLHVNFKSMILKKKKGKKQEVKIRRSFQNGLYMMYRRSAHQTQIHIKLNHLQIDNQLPACTFPCALAMVPLPRSVLEDTEPKPFAEFSFVMNQSEHSDILQIKYLRLLIQEFDVRVDRGLIEAILSLLNNEQLAVPYTSELFLKDMANACPKLQERIVITKATRQKSFYHDLHISPVMMHLSYSRGGLSKSHGPNSKQVASRAGLHLFSIFEVFAKSLGVTLTEIQDVVFRLAYFDHKHTFYNKAQLKKEIITHYKRQLFKQFYVLVFGLEILGNPYGVVVDLAGSVQDFFYQPYIGAIQGPEEFAEGLEIGLISLISSSVGGVTGMASRLTGTIGKGIAVLAMDEDYQRRRQEAINRQPENFTENIARGLEGLGHGVYDGVTGIVKKPLEGARQRGFSGFAGGLGRGVVGVVARPLSGLIDFASNSLGAVKSIATNSKPATALRPTRFIRYDGIIRPYIFNEAAGYKIFRETNKGQFADTEHFICHAFLNQNEVFIVTNHRVFLSLRKPLLGFWSASWNYAFEELERPEPKETAIYLKFKNKKNKSGFLGLNSSSTANGKLVIFTSSDVAKEVNSKLLQAYDEQSGTLHHWTP